MWNYILSYIFIHVFLLFFSLEYEEVLNQKAISSMQSGDRCLVKLNSNYSEKWNSAYLHSIQHDLANVFVMELNEK